MSKRLHAKKGTGPESGLYCLFLQGLKHDTSFIREITYKLKGNTQLGKIAHLDQYKA